MTGITDEFMMQMMTATKNYTVVILKAGPGFSRPDARQITWEHVRRNFELRAEGLLSVVCPVMDNSSIKGIGIFNADVEATGKIMDGDPGVQAAVFTYELHPCRSFPGDSLPG